MRETSPDTHHLVYIDAFRTDHTGEPLLALLAEIINVCCPVNHDDVAVLEQRKNWINKFAAGAKFASKTALKAGLGHLLKQNIRQLSDDWGTALDDAAKEVGEKAINAGVDKSIELVTATLLQEQIESEKNLQALQQTLKELASTKPIILFIDELDRCRPDYAIDIDKEIKIRYTTK
ncbi:KAP family NTPase [Wielerella bovis]|uniref:P-loop NTPase fold protein n=1 Tax=Wielerella bovis TaxID=2917790 RepID=UPI002019EE2E|nr:P-loop NTPase fold protein [Wielerella bovis]ULJ68647.1 KAP family NTPase [Wielerella bovis]